MSIQIFSKHSSLYDGGAVLFNEWRKALCRVAGYGYYDDLFSILRADKSRHLSDGLFLLLAHQDNDGELEVDECKLIYDRLLHFRNTLPLFKSCITSRYNDDSLNMITKDFVVGLKEAIKNNEMIMFR